MAGIVAIRDTCVGRLSLAVSVINFGAKPSAVSMVARKGVVHFCGVYSWRVSFFLLVACVECTVPVLVRWAIAGCAQS